MQITKTFNQMMTIYQNYTCDQNNNYYKEQVGFQTHV